MLRLLHEPKISKVLKKYIKKSFNVPELQKSPENWDRFSPGTTVPSLTGKVYNKCDQRLQLNPRGAGDDGKGGVAMGYLYIVQ